MSVENQDHRTGGMLNPVKLASRPGFSTHFADRFALHSGIEFGKIPDESAYRIASLNGNGTHLTVSSAMGFPTESTVRKKLVATSCAVAMRSDRIVKDDMPACKLRSGLRSLDSLPGRTRFFNA